MFRSFYFKISIIFLALMSALVIAQYSIATYLSTDLLKGMSEEFYQAYGKLVERYFLQFLMTNLGLLVLIFAILGLLLFSIMTRRLRAITNVVEEFQKGDFNSRIPIEGAEDELTQLGQTFNKMADKIEDYIDRLQTKDLLRRELISNVSHDLRTPLASAQGYVETILVKKDSLNEDEKQRFLQIVLSNIKSLEQLVKDLFELSLLDAQEKKPALEPFNISELLQDSVQKFMPLSQEKNVVIALDAEEKTAHVNADLALIERAISNLIDNAIKFTEPGGKVFVSLARKRNEQIVRVEDTGIGISGEELPHIFERYRIARGRNSRQKNGSGLGLAIVKGIIEAHGQSLEYGSDTKKGTWFEFSLPISTVVHSDTESIIIEDEIAP